MDLHAATPDAPHLGPLRIYYEGGDANQRSARVVSNDHDPQNKVLRFRLTEPNVVVQWPSGPQRKSRVQSELYGNVELRDFYQKVRLRLAPELACLRDYPDKITWFTLMEFWNHAGWTDEPFIRLGEPETHDFGRVIGGALARFPENGGRTRRLRWDDSRELRS